jgi:hypothetical protein
MLVQAKPGTRCPKEGKPREYISDVKAEDMPDTAYYRRLVAEGSLLRAKAEKKTVKREEGKVKE